MSKKRWTEVNVGGFGSTQEEAVKDAEDAAFKVCVRLGIREAELKVIRCTYDGWEKIKAVGIEMLVFTDQKVDPRHMFVNIPARQRF